MTFGDHQQRVAASLEDDLRRMTGHKDLHLASELHRMIGGFDTETYAFRLHGAPDTLNGDLVLRLFRASDPDDRVRFESTIQDAMAARGYPAPGVPLDTAGREILGRPYLVMRRLPGRSLLELISAGPADISDNGAELLARTQARLHGLSATEAMMALARAGLDPSMHTPFRLLNDIQQLAQTTRDPILIELGRWLEDRRPPQPETERLCHGDFHPGNMLVENMQATGVIDWTNVAFGHAEYDVATTQLMLSIWPIEDTAESGQRRATMKRLASAYSGAYCSLRSPDQTLLRYYTALRAGRALARTVAARHGTIPGAAPEGYAWSLPPIYEAIRSLIRRETHLDAGLLNSPHPPAHR